MTLQNLAYKFYAAFRGSFVFFPNHGGSRQMKSLLESSFLGYLAFL